jgi:hypothetical protein
MSPAIPDEYLGLHQGLHGLVQEEGVALGPLDQHALEGLEALVLAQELAPREAPQRLQNWLPAGLLWRHAGQVSSRPAPHELQKRAPGRFSCWHRGHCISGLH